MNRYYYPTKYQSRNQFLSLGVRCIFISHQKKDSSEARKVAEYLEAAGLDVYFDEYDGDLRIQHQNDNPQVVTAAILKGINNSSHMLVVVSPNTLFSTWVPFEIGYGYDKTDLVILCLKGIPKGQLPEYVRTKPIVRDIYDLNLMISRLAGQTTQLLVESRKIRDYSSSDNPLVKVMDGILNDQY
jgi:hypothetical protein